MKAAVLRGVGDLRLEDVADPTPCSDEALIRVRAAGLCGTDVRMWTGGNTEGTFPFIPGHEWSGEVVEVGRDITRFRVGDRVVAEVPINCHVCDNCQDGLDPNMCPDFELYGFSWQYPGGMAEYTLAREERLFSIPDNVSYEEAALVEPLSVAYHGVWGSAGGVAPHDRVVVIGCGPIGLFAMAACKASGAPVDRRRAAGLPAPAGLSAWRRCRARPGGGRSGVSQAQSRPAAAGRRWFGVLGQQSRAADRDRRSRTSRDASC